MNYVNGSFGMTSKKLKGALEIGKKKKKKLRERKKEKKKKKSCFRTHLSNFMKVVLLIRDFRES